MMICVRDGVVNGWREEMKELMTRTNKICLVIALILLGLIIYEYTYNRPEVIRDGSGATNFGPERGDLQERGYQGIIDGGL